MSQTLLDLFPEIGLQLSKFRKKWGEVFKRKNFFETFARENKLNPLDPETWYRPSTMKNLSMRKEVKQIVPHHGGSVIKALADLFPNIGLETSKFKKKS